jgi:subtilase family serine protease
MRRPLRPSPLRLVAIGLLAGVLLTVLPGPIHRVQGGAVHLVASGGMVTDQRAIPAGSVAVPVAGGRLVDLEISVTPNDPAGLRAFDAAVSNPSGPQYRQFLTESTFAARFDPASASISALESYFSGFGGWSYETTPDHLGLRLTIPVEGADKALSIQYVLVHPASGAPFITAIGAPHLPGAVAPLVEGIGGLSNVGSSSLQLHLRTTTRGAIQESGSPGDIVVNGSSGGWWFTGSDYVQGYRESALMPTSPGSTVKNATFAGDEAIATILMSGYNDTTRTNLPPWDPAVIQAYYNDTFPNTTGAGYNWSEPSLAGFPVDIQGVGAPSPGSLGLQGDDTGNEVENSLDLEMAGSFAPGASLNSFYFAASLFPNTSSSSSALQNIADDFATCLSQALTHNYDGSRLVAITNSYGLPDLNDSLWNTELEQAAATGVTVVASSGDQGNAPVSDTGAFQGQNVSWPASAAFNDSGTIAVGGLTVNLTGIPSGSFDGTTLNDGFDRSVGGISSLSAWYNTLGGQGQFAGSEGGVSSVFTEPYWQRHSAAQPAIVNVTVQQESNALGRAEPDISFPANATLIYVAANASIVYFETVQGTSVSAPIFAGFLAESAAVTGHLFGYLDPELYRMGSYFAAHSGASGDPILDVASGGNYLFRAQPGWDGATGWGTLDPVDFLSADANASVTGFQYVGPSPGLPHSTPVAPSFLQQHAEVLVLLALGAAIIFAILAVTVGSRPSSRSPYSTVGAGVYTPTPGGPPPPYAPAGYGTPSATFLCPYCGSVRPAEPTRCPSCGAF